MESINYLNLVFFASFFCLNDAVDICCNSKHSKYSLKDFQSNFPDRSYLKITLVSNITKSD